MFENIAEPHDPLIRAKEAARYLRIGAGAAPQTLARKFHEGTGRLCTHVGDRAMYRQSHLDQYFASKFRPRRSSSERAGRARCLRSRATSSLRLGVRISESVQLRHADRTSFDLRTERLEGTRRLQSTLRHITGSVSKPFAERALLRT